MPEPIGELLHRARRRLTTMLLAHSTIWILGATAAACSVLAGIARVVVVSWAELAILVMLGIALIASVVSSVRKRPSVLATSIEVDNRLGGFDRVSTAVERLQSTEPLSELDQRQLTSAAAWSNGRSLDDFGPVLPAPRLMALSAVALLGLAALVLAPSSADAIAAERAEVQQIIEEEAAALEELAEELPEEVANELRVIVEELRESETLEEALAKLAEAQQTLAERADPNALAKKTALSGLEGRLAQQALSEGGSLEESLSAIAENLADATEEEKAALAEELADRADDLAGIDDELSQALDQAASALANGEVPDLGAIGQAAQGAASDVSASDATAQASSAVGSAQQSLAQAAVAQAAQGSEGGQGEGQGEGSGEGQGEGSGGGQGAGGGGSGSGGAGSAPGATTGGTGNGSLGRDGFSDNDAIATPVRGDIVDVDAVQSSDEVQVDIFGNILGDAVGTTDGAGLANTPSLSYSDVFAVYQNTALESLDTMSVPLALQDIVNSYFTELEP